jgi:hypothetical protein
MKHLLADNDSESSPKGEFFALELYESLGLREAAKFVKMRPDALAKEANAGRAPGAKPNGKNGCWVFLKIDLIHYIRSKYAKEKQCLSLNAGNTGAFTSSRQAAKKLGSVLARKIDNKPKSMRTI